MIQAYFIWVLFILIEYYSCQRCSQEPLSKSVLKQKIDISELVDDKYGLIKFDTINFKQNYERWIAKEQFTNKLIILKFYIKDKIDDKVPDLWRQKHNYPAPAMECQQLAYLNNLAVKQNLDSCKLEKCLIGEQGGESMKNEIPYYIAFRYPLGISFTELCVRNLCRERMVYIAKGLVMAVKLATSGDNSLFEITNMNLDNCYFYEVHDNFFVYVSDMKFNSNPETESTNKPWSKDLNTIGEMLAKMLSRRCEFVINPKARISALNLYRQVQSLPDYVFDDSELNVPSQVNYPSKQGFTFQDKKDMLAESLYDFIIRCLNTDLTTQFKDPDDALQHPFLNIINLYERDKLSDMIF